MAYVGDSGGGFRRRLLGYDRGQVDRVIAAAHSELMRVRHERDELKDAAASVERIGGEVAEMLRAMAARVSDVEATAHAEAARIRAAAEADAARLRTEAQALLDDARLRVEQRAVDLTHWRDAALADLRELGGRITEMAESIADLRPEELAAPDTPDAPDAPDVPDAVETDRVENGVNGAGLDLHDEHDETPAGDDALPESGVERELASVLRWIHERTEPSNGA